MAFLSSTRRLLSFSTVLMLGALAGCSGGSLGKVTGKVTYKGQPVTEGMITFSVASGDGAAASAKIGSDGSYKLLSANDQKAGATVGKNNVVYAAPPAAWPEGTTPKASTQPPTSKFDGLVPKDRVVDVKSGDNTIDIELVPPAAQQGGR